jgi:hypothetical protein
MKTAWGWSAKLTRTIVLKDGTRLATLADVRALILNEPKHIQERGSWQHAAEVMILAAERGGTSKRLSLRLKTLCFWKRDTCVISLGCVDLPGTGTPVRLCYRCAVTLPAGGIR